MHLNPNLSLSLSYLLMQTYIPLFQVYLCVFLSFYNLSYVDFVLLAYTNINIFNYILLLLLIFSAIQFQRSLGVEICLN